MVIIQFGAEAGCHLDNSAEGVASGRIEKYF